MRRTINISVPEAMHRYIIEQARNTSVSEYIRRLVLQEQERREDYAARPTMPLMTMNDNLVIAQALGQLEKLRAILENTVDDYDRGEEPPEKLTIAAA
jgi:hypothetical protein